MAYQICFDLYESASQQFLSSVIQNLRTVGTPIPSVPGSMNTGTVPTQEKDRWVLKQVQITLFFFFSQCTSGTILIFQCVVSIIYFFDYLFSRQVFLQLFKMIYFECVHHENVKLVCMCVC